ncbi:MAG: Zn-dependent protease [Deltaproteobacteria bacterium]|nr:Zn-dependent protease [Deltaproteobacteria bacterium]
MNLRNLVITSLLGSFVALSATGAMAAPPKQPPPRSPAAKLNKKQLEIDRHEWMAQYYLRRANDLVGAAKEYKAILALDAGNASASLALASIYLRDKKDKQAIEVLTKLTKQNPKNDEAWLVLAELQVHAGDDKGLKASVDKALAINPQNVNAYSLVFERAQTRLKAGDAAAKPDALDAARKIMQFTRRQGPAYKLAERAVVELSGEPIELTIYDAKLAYAAAFETGTIGKINQQMALAWVETARVQRAGDHNTEARAALDKALALDGELAVAHVELGILDKISGKTDAAANHFVAAIDADPYGSVGDRGLAELTKVKPTHPRVTEGVLEGRRGDVFSTERYKSVVALIERELGGVEASAPEKAVLEEIVQRLADGSAVKQQFHVQLVASPSVNAFALSDGRVYVTRGLLDLLKKKFPKRSIDANNDILGHVLAHELAHVIRRHTMNTAVFQEAVKDTNRMLDPSVLTHVTRLHEIDADREGIVMAFLAGYHPRGGIEFMEVMGQDLEIPKHLDHPTFEERVEYLTEYWTNDVRYAFVSFKLGVTAMDRGAKLEATDMQQAIAAYEEAVDDFKRFRAMLPSLKDAMNDLGIAYTKLGVLAMTAQDSPLGRWQTRFSLERDSAVKYVGLARPDDSSKTRGTDKARIPWQLREAIAALKEALATDETYSKARLNLASAYVAANQLDNASAMLAKVEPKQGVTDGDVELIRGIVLAESKDYGKARASFEKAIASQSAKRAASYNLAKTLELAGKKDEAKRAYQQYAKLYPGGPWAKAADAAAAKL